MYLSLKAEEESPGIKIRLKRMNKRQARMKSSLEGLRERNERKERERVRKYIAVRKKGAKCEEIWAYSQEIRLMEEAYCQENKKRVAISVERISMKPCMLRVGTK